MWRWHPPQFVFRLIPELGNNSSSLPWNFVLSLNADFHGQRLYEERNGSMAFHWWVRLRPLTTTETGRTWRAVLPYPHLVWLASRRLREEKEISSKSYPMNQFYPNPLYKQPVVVWQLRVISHSKSLPFLLPPFSLCRIYLTKAMRKGKKIKNENYCNTQTWFVGYQNTFIRILITTLLCWCVRAALPYQLQKRECCW